MALGTDYAGQDCSLARALEVVGERWTLLVLRDCFLGVRRFSDFAAHLEISRAVLAARLGSLVDAGLLVRVPRGRWEEYELTERGRSLWPALHALIRWGDEQSGTGRPIRLFAHTDCGTDVDAAGRCPTCGTVPEVTALTTRLGPGARRKRKDDEVSRVLTRPHAMLAPIR